MHDVRSFIFFFFFFNVIQKKSHLSYKSGGKTKTTIAALEEVSLGSIHSGLNRLGCFCAADAATARIPIAASKSNSGENLSLSEARPPRWGEEEQNHVTVPAGSLAGRTQLQPPFYSFSLGRAPSGGGGGGGEFGGGRGGGGEKKKNLPPQGRRGKE